MKVAELGVIVVAITEGDGEADLPHRECGAICDYVEWLGWVELIIGDLECLEGLDGEDVEPCSAVDECLGHEDVADGWGAEHWEGAWGRRALELVFGVESDDLLGPPEVARAVRPGKRRVHLTGELLEDAKVS